ncbi:hypothetical protein PHJA_002621800 [Phtheirospermum japonicum]|uniref:Uncharacterized protein n=1 Tax=Phtheirospermum japonicum TaxID=374723 RepID=A0A830CW29_9LAMI|nr:hypothetical protein PHJA_002621800 [Phtheirospermum japonicum]
MEADQGCATPRSRIPAALVCPPPPKKQVMQTKRDPPTGGYSYFQSPEIDAFFRSVAQHGRVAWA